MKIQDALLELGDEKNAEFQAKLTPGIPHESCLGTRIPELRKLAKQYTGTAEAEAFLRVLPHTYYDENILHGILISLLKDYDRVIRELECFLPYVDNWAVCDVIRPAVFKKNTDRLIEKTREWIDSPHTYTCRFGVEMLMTYCLDDKFSPEYMDLPAAVRSEEYYVNMMLAWFYATALAKQWDCAVKILLENRLDTWTHNKTIQKARESFRISQVQKAYLNTLKRK